MPNRDGTGPRGDGSPGRGLGNCTNSRRVGNQQSGFSGSNRGSLLRYGTDLLVNAIYKMLSKRTTTRRR